jgi:glycosyltransferase involved in cell wall biosynthesis
MFFSIIIPLYNRPQEIDELLESLTHQTYSSFEVIVVEDGSQIDAREIVERYQDRLDLTYVYKINEGQGVARNLGFSKAKGDYFIAFDSDCVIPPSYLQAVFTYLSQHPADGFGGPDAAHPSFTPIQKAINYSMTSFLTTGGIRGKQIHIGTYHLRGFNMGISRKAFEQTGGFRWTNFSEDMELSLRMQHMGLTVHLIPEAYVYHKRRSTFSQFFKQTHQFGKGRIRIFTELGKDLKLVHFFPAAFTLYFILVILIGILFWIGTQQNQFNAFEATLVTGVFGMPMLIYLAAIWIDASYQNRSPYIGVLAIYSTLLQHLAYGSGFIIDFFRKVVLSFRRNSNK